jgi:1,2-diacylglycerol 3-alpha-glucosyltransferase
MISGASIVVRQIVEGMSARGHSVLVLAASDAGPGYADSRGGLRVSRLASLHNPMRVGQRLVLWPQRSVTSEFRTFQPQILHAHDPFGVGLVAILNARRLCIPIVMTSHQLPWFVSPSLPNVAGLRHTVENLLWGYAGWIARLCDCVVAPTPPVADIIRSRTAACPEIIPCGIDTQRFSPVPASPDEQAMLRTKYGLDPGLPVVLFVGRIDADKRVDQVVRAAAGVVRPGHAQLLIVGDGSRKQGVIELCRSLGIHDWIVFPRIHPCRG